MLTLNTNLSSLVAQTSLKTSTNKLNQAIERMTTGFKVNHASDNAANYSIITDIDTRLGAYEIAEENASMGLDILTTASDTLSLIEDRIIRLRTLQEYAQNGTYGTDSLMAINSECNSLIDEIARVYETSEYNGIRFFSYADSSAPTETIQEATISTQLSQLGIDASSFSIYDSSKNLLVTCDTDKDDTIGDVFELLNQYDFETSITGGVITITNKNGSYITGDLADALGMNIIETECVQSTEQESVKEITYTEQITATGATTFGELGLSGAVTVNDKYGNVVGTVNTDSDTTIDDFFVELNNYGITGSIADGVISLTGSTGNYASGVVIDGLGIRTVDSTSKVTTGTEQTSTLKVTTMVSTTNTVTVWETTTISSTETKTLVVTNTVTETTSGSFLVDITHVDTSTMTALGSVSSSEKLGVGTYSISTAEELAKLSTMQNSGLIENGSTFVLADNIDLSAYSNGDGWVPIGAIQENGFSGTFDGNGYVISNLYINGSADTALGLFGYSIDTVVIKNLGLENVDISGDHDMGALIGMDGGYTTIENYYSSGRLVNVGSNGYSIGGLIGNHEGGEIALRNCYTSGTVDGGSYCVCIGGLIGWTYSASFNDVIENCFSTANVSGDDSVGGLTGALTMLMRNCYFTGSVSGNTNVGLITGTAYTAEVNNCYALSSSNTELIGNIDEINNLSDVGDYVTITNVQTYPSNPPFTYSNDGVISYQTVKISQATETTTLYTTTTTSTTHTETLLTTTTSSATGTNILREFGFNNTGYLTLYSGGTASVMTLNSATTLDDTLSYLNNHGITASLTNGVLRLRPQQGSYITGMSSSLQGVLGLTSSYYTSRNGLKNTNSNQQTNTVVRTMSESMTFSQAGITNGTLRVRNTDGSYTLAALQQSLQNLGFRTNYTNNKLGIYGTGDMYLETTSLSNFLNLGSVNKTTGITTVNNPSKNLSYTELHSTQSAAPGLTLQIGIDSSSASSLTLNIGFSIINMDEFREIGLDLETDYLSKLDDVLARISKKQTEYGAAQNRLESALDEISTQYENLVSSRSTLRDSVVSELSSLYIQQQILQQASATLLATANQTPALALQLL